MYPHEKSTAEAASVSNNAFLTPARLLLLLCLTALLLFGDRGCVSSNSVNGARTSPEAAGYGIQGDFDLSLWQDGLVAAALMVGLMLSAPAAAMLSKRVNSLRLIGAGLACWIAGTAASGLAPTFPLLLAARLLVGTGSGPFIAVAAPLIDDRAPRRQKSLWLAMMFLCFPSGFALGYIYAGLVATAWGWRWAFLLESAAMVPLALLCLLGPAVDIRRAHSVSPAAGGSWSLQKAAGVLAADLRALCRHPACLLTMLAMALYNGALGGYAYFGPKAARDVFVLDPETGDLLFGAITVATGVLGTLSGGLALDGMGAAVRAALLLCTLGVTSSCALILVAFAAMRSLLPFSLAFAVGEYCMFLLAAPAGAVLMWSVPADLRPFALSMGEVMQHLAGDIPSPPLLGWLQGKVGNWRLTMCACTALLAGSAALFAAAWWSAPAAVARQEAILVVEEEDDGDQEEGGRGAAAQCRAAAWEGEGEEGGGLTEGLLAGHVSSDG